LKEENLRLPFKQRQHTSVWHKIMCIITPRKQEEDKSENRSAWLIYSLYDNKIQKSYSDFLQND